MTRSQRDLCASQTRDNLRPHKITERDAQWDRASPARGVSGLPIARTGEPCANASKGVTAGETAPHFKPDPVNVRCWSEGEAPGRRIRSWSITRNGWTVTREVRPHRIVDPRLSHRDPVDEGCNNWQAMALLAIIVICGGLVVGSAAFAVVLL